MRRMCILLLVFTVSPVIAASQEAGSSKTVDQNPAAFPHSVNGFRAQFTYALQRNCAAPAPAKKRELSEFKLSDPSNWFTQNFDADQARKLEKRYKDLFEADRKSVV